MRTAAPLLLAALCAGCFGRSEITSTTPGDVELPPGGDTAGGADPSPGDAGPGSGPVMVSELLATYTPPTWGTAPYVTEAFTPAANSLIVLCVMVCTAGGGPVTDFDILDSAGLSWTTRSTVASNGTFYESAVYWLTAPAGPTPASMTLTVEASPTVYQFAVWAADFQVSDVALAVGATGSLWGAGEVGPLSYALSAAPASGSVVLAALSLDDNGLTFLTEAPGWTELWEVGPNPGVLFHIQIDDTQPDDTVEYDDVTSSSTADSFAGAAFELR